MQKALFIIIALLFSYGAMAQTDLNKASNKLADQQVHVLTQRQYDDRLLGALVGQAIGIAKAQGYGETEQGYTFALSSPWFTGQFSFLEALTKKGPHVRPDLVAFYLQQSIAPLAGGVLVAKQQLRYGMPQPFTGQLQYNPLAEDASWQTLSQAYGLAFPGLLNHVAHHSFIAGSVVADGEALYAATLTNSTLCLMMGRATWADALTRNATTLPTASETAKLRSELRAQGASLPAWVTSNQANLTGARSGPYAAALVDAILFQSNGNWSKAWQLCQQLKLTMPQVMGPVGAALGAHLGLDTLKKITALPSLDHPVFGTGLNLRQVGFAYRKLLLEVIKISPATVKYLGVMATAIYQLPVKVGKPLPFIKAQPITQVSERPSLTLVKRKEGNFTFKSGTQGSVVWFWDDYTSSQGAEVTHFQEVNAKRQNHLYAIQDNGGYAFTSFATQSFLSDSTGQLSNYPLPISNPQASIKALGAQNWLIENTCKTEDPMLRYVSVYADGVKRIELVKPGDSFNFKDSLPGTKYILWLGQSYQSRELWRTFATIPTATPAFKSSAKPQIPKDRGERMPYWLDYAFVGKNRFPRDLKGRLWPIASPEGLTLLLQVIDDTLLVDPNARVQDQLALYLAHDKGVDKFDYRYPAVAGIKQLLGIEGITAIWLNEGVRRFQMIHIPQALLVKKYLKPNGNLSLNIVLKDTDNGQTLDRELALFQHLSHDIHDKQPLGTLALPKE